MPETVADEVANLALALANLTPSDFARLTRLERARIAAMLTGEPPDEHEPKVDEADG